MTSAAGGSLTRHQTQTPTRHVGSFSSDFLGVDNDNTGASFNLFVSRLLTLGWGQRGGGKFDKAVNICRKVQRVNSCCRRWRRRRRWRRYALWFAALTFVRTTFALFGIFICLAKRLWEYGRTGRGLGSNPGFKGSQRLNCLLQEGFRHSVTRNLGRQEMNGALPTRPPRWTINWWKFW